MGRIENNASPLWTLQRLCFEPDVAADPSDRGENRDPDTATQAKKNLVDKGGAIRERPLGCKRKMRRLTGESIAIMCPALSTRRSDRWPMCGRPAKVKGDSAKLVAVRKAFMCPASSCGNMTAGPDRFRERHPNRWAVFIYHGPARIFSFVGSTDYYLLLRPLATSLNPGHRRACQAVVTS